MPKSKRKHRNLKPVIVVDPEALRKLQMAINVSILKSLLGVMPLTHNERKRALRLAKLSLKSTEAAPK